MLAVIWIGFAILFLAVGIFHVRQSLERVEELPFEQVFKGVGGSVQVLAGDPDRSVKRLTENLNVWVRKLNVANHRANIVESFGYFLAAGTAVFSALVELKVLGG